MSGKKQQPTSRPKGRPPKGAPPALPAEEVDRLLVFGEVVTCDDGESRTVVYPSDRDLAERYRVSTTLIAKYSKDHNCLRRREQAKARVQAQADQKLVELRATAVALSKDDELRIIDDFLAGFEKALAEGRVRFDNPGDFNGTRPRATSASTPSAPAVATPTGSGRWCWRSSRSAGRSGAGRRRLGFG